MNWAGLVLWAAAAAPGQAQQHVAFPFQAGGDGLRALTFFGPEAESVAAPDAGGLRIRLPEGREDTNVVGVELTSRIRGNFDIAMGYELLATGEPAPDLGAGVHLRITFDSPAPLAASLERLRRPGGDIVSANRIIPSPDGNEKYSSRPTQAEAPRGRLRLLRRGSQLDYLIAEGGGAYRHLRSEEIGTHDVQSVRLFCSSGWRPVVVDVRLTDLVIDADQFLDGVPSASKKPEHAGRAFLVLLGAVAVGVALLAGLLLAYLVHRTRGRKPVPGGRPTPPQAPAEPVKVRKDPRGIQAPRPPPEKA